MENDALFATLNALVDAWCERRELALLRIILAVYPLSSGRSDEWHALYHALRSIRARHSAHLPEQEKLGAAIVTLGQMLFQNES